MVKSNGNKMEELVGSQCMKSSKQKKLQKRQEPKASDEDVEEIEDFSKMIGQYNASVKKRKPSGSIDFIPKQRLLETMTQQLEARKEANATFLSSLSDLHVSLELDYQTMKENEAKIQHMAASVVKCMQQATSSFKQKLSVFEDIHTKYKNLCEEQESDEKATVAKMADELEENINELQKKLVTDVKKKHMDHLRKSLLAMHDF